MSNVRKGRLIPVENKGRKFGSATGYYACFVENEKGKKERCLLFTESELAVAEARAQKNKEDLPKKSAFIDAID
ncbi:MAG: hypothetical protein V4615_04940 [Bacteroidota bacterium]